jgi:hypothetical protein
MLRFTRPLFSDVAAGIFGTASALVAIASGIISLMDAYEKHGNQVDYVAAGTQVVGGVLLIAAAIMTSAASAPGAAAACAVSGTVIGLEIGASLMLVTSAITSGAATVADAAIPDTQKVATYHFDQIGKSAAYLTVSNKSPALKKAYLEPRRCALRHASSWARSASRRTWLAPKSRSTGSPLGTAPITEEIYLDPGPHTLTATLAKYQTARAKVEVVKGGTDKVALTLLDEVNAPPPPPEALPTGSPAASAAPPSSSAPLPPPPSRPNLFCVIVPGVVAAAGVGLGVFFAVASNGHATDAAAASARLGSKRCPAGGADCDALTQALSSRDSSANAAMGMFIGGGVFGVAALAAGIWRATVPAAPPDTRAARFLPVLSPNQMGLVFDGTW